MPHRDTCQNCYNFLPTPGGVFPTGLVGLSLPFRSEWMNGNEWMNYWMKAIFNKWMVMNEWIIEWMNAIFNEWIIEWMNAIFNEWMILNEYYP